MGEGTLQERLGAREELVTEFVLAGRRTRFALLSGKEVWPAGMEGGCPANWTVSDVLNASSWETRDSGDQAEPGRWGPLEHNPTAVVFNGIRYTGFQGAHVYLAEGEPVLHVVVDEPHGKRKGENE